MPTTSRESSNLNLYFSSTARAHRAPATRPRRRARPGLRLAQAGVMATRPDTAPEAAPTDVALPSLSFSTTSQPSTAAAVAPRVLTMISPTPASPFANSAPALNPNQPNQRIAAPSSTNGT